MKRWIIAAGLIVLLAAGCGTTSPAPAASESAPSVSASSFQEAPVGVLTDVEQWYQTLDRNLRRDIEQDTVFARRLDERYTLIYHEFSMYPNTFVLLDRQSGVATQISCPEWWIACKALYDADYSTKKKELTFYNDNGERPIFDAQDFPHSMTYNIGSGRWNKDYLPIAVAGDDGLEGEIRRFPLGGSDFPASIDHVDYTETQMKIFFRPEDERLKEFLETYIPYVECLYRPETREVTLLLPEIQLQEAGQFDAWGKMPGVGNLQVKENQTVTGKLGDPVSGTVISFTVASNTGLKGSVHTVGLDREGNHLLLEILIDK